jgi:hypothetical protein
MEAKSESKSSALDEDDLKHGAKALSHVIAASKVCIWACKQTNSAVGAASANERACHRSSLRCISSCVHDFHLVLHYDACLTDLFLAISLLCNSCSVNQDLVLVTWRQ